LRWAQGFEMKKEKNISIKGEIKGAKTNLEKRGQENRSKSKELGD